MPHFARKGKYTIFGTSKLFASVVPVHSDKPATFNQNAVRYVTDNPDQLEKRCNEENITCKVTKKKFAWMLQNLKENNILVALYSSPANMDPSQLTHVPSVLSIDTYQPKKATSGKNLNRESQTLYMVYSENHNIPGSRQDSLLFPQAGEQTVPLRYFSPAFQLAPQPLTCLNGQMGWDWRMPKYYDGPMPKEQPWIMTPSGPERYQPVSDGSGYVTPIGRPVESKRSQTIFHNNWILLKFLNNPGSKNCWLNSLFQLIKNIPGITDVFEDLENRKYSELFGILRDTFDHMERHVSDPGIRSQKFFLRDLREYFTAKFPRNQPHNLVEAFEYLMEGLKSDPFLADARLSLEYSRTCTHCKSKTSEASQAFLLDLSRPTEADIQIDLTSSI